MDTARPDPSPLIELATAYWNSATLIAAVRLDVFSRLSEGAVDAPTLAERLGTDPVATESLLAALISLGLVDKDGEAFSNTQLSDAFLVSGRPGFLGPAMLYNGDVFPLWSRLDQVVRDGRPPQTPDAYLGADDERTRNFVYGMHHRALGVGQAVSRCIDLRGRTRLADIGGGPGTYSALLCKATPGLAAEVLDLPPVVAIAKQIVASMGAAASVTCTAFDYYKDALPGRYDAALISGVLHREQPDQVARILGVVAAAIEPGGVLYISDVMVNDDRRGPLFATMFELNMRVLAHDGRCHAPAELTAWLDTAGFEVTDRLHLPPPIHYTVLRAVRR